ncbi:WD40/YVTN repeat-like-containing domain protein [Cordyceps fumosorosea ARSEF 2679]|uniref:Dipeptidyl-peptidase V n=1 Tax=Cordyceps fumosorosea (strain ARSEF 2679) TaxID=1081104 RepID=A0A162LN46_CORFA|nr:WD40/YVTN repeat-like-containing domain protein [Cordyceps fumosorosea ARSEF 2679]OAA73104.1 WD40/YVTN repeat-like-containing domain protein [Cordyceps fumosorosea ARSEF 2679]
MAQGNSKPTEYVFDRELAESLVDLEVPQDIKFSPDGTKIVHVAGRAAEVKKGENYVSSLWLASSSLPGSARQLTSGSFHDSGPTWHPDGNRILFSSDRAEAGSKQGVWPLRLDGGDATAVTPADADESVQKWALSPDGRTVAYLSADEASEEEKKRKGTDEEEQPDVWGEKWKYARLRLVDVETKETRVLVSEERHVTDLTWSRDGKEIAFRSNRNTEPEESDISGGTISTVDVASGAVRDLTTDQAQFVSLTWARDGKIYFIGITPVGDLFGGSAVFYVDPAEDAPSLTRAAYGEDDDAVELREVGGRVLAKRDSRLVSVVSEVEGGELFRFPDGEIGDWDVWFDPETGGARLATALSTINDPYEVFVVEEGRENVKLSEHGRALGDRRFGTGRVLRCGSTDGEVELDGIYLAPADATDGEGKPRAPLPTLVSIHGGPSASDGVGWDVFGRYWTALALAQGYGVLLPQYRGSSGRGSSFGAWSGRGVGVQDHADVVALTDEAVRRGWADAERLMVGGWSQGGYLAYLCSGGGGRGGGGGRRLRARG